MADVEGARGVAARANEGVGSGPQAKGKAFLAYQQVDFAVMAHGFEAKLHAQLKRELTSFIMSGRAVKR
jgi:hypothetical protein